MPFPHFPLADPLPAPHQPPSAGDPHHQEWEASRCRSFHVPQPRSRKRPNPGRPQTEGAPDGGLKGGDHRRPLFILWKLASTTSSWFLRFTQKEVEKRTLGPWGLSQAGLPQDAGPGSSISALVPLRLEAPLNSATSRQADPAKLHMQGLLLRGEGGGGVPQNQTGPQRAQ